MDSAAVATSTPAVSHGRFRTTDDWVVHNKIGAATTSTPSASPAHQFSTALTQGVASWIELMVPPISPPKNGPIRQAPTTKATKSRRLRRSGGPPHQASTTEAPTSGSSTLADEKPAAIQTGLP